MQAPDKNPSHPDPKAANRRLGLILLSIVVVFFLGFFAKMMFLG
ncbi:cytochrome oxidase small assembly protein [Cupriavidus sp. NPDC089707]